jgi:hypothetical protein
MTELGLFAEVEHGTINWKHTFTAALKGSLKCYFVERTPASGLGASPSG